MREISSDRNGTNIRGLEEKKIETKEETINRGRKKEGDEARVGPDRSSKATFLSFTPSREDLEVEESPIRLGRLMPGS